MDIKVSCLVVAEPCSRWRENKDRRKGEGGSKEVNDTSTLPRYYTYCTKEPTMVRGHLTRSMLARNSSKTQAVLQIPTPHALMHENPDESQVAR